MGISTGGPLRSLPLEIPLLLKMFVLRWPTLKIHSLSLFIFLERTAKALPQFLLEEEQKKMTT
jgi:hypothetical protein